MEHNKYKVFTSEDLLKLINNQIKPYNQTIDYLNSDPVYHQLFAGLDISMLNLMCMQVKYTLAGHKPDEFINVINTYADSIINLVPQLKEVSSKISSQASYFSYCMSNAFTTYRKNDLKKFNSICADLDRSNTEFEEIHIKNITNVNSLQNNLCNFIISTLNPVVSEETQWTDYGLEKCLSNDKFIDGTKASLYNSQTIISLTASSVSQSNQIIHEIFGYSSDEIMFTLHGQSQIWNIISKTSKKLETNLNNFKYYPPIY